MQAIFITGGGSGIGRATAVLFAARGWRVGLADVNEAGMAETAALLGDAPVTTHRLDVRDRAAWDTALADFAKASGGRIDAIFNNAGIGVGGDFAATSVDDLQRCVDVNLMGVVWGAHAGYRYLKESRGCLVNTASAAGIYGTGGVGIYSATKFAVRGLTEALDGEWHGQGIRVRALLPSFIDTAILDNTGTGSNQTMRERVRRAGLEFTPVEIAAQTVWDAVHGDGLHYLVGKTARRMWFGSRFLRGSMRKLARK
ncbi:SDR family oxidoreductase [Sphingomonas sp. MG17]|uniref:SDR family oxidoreductase n=1 Tax=Sphingomonas tagetis TaxID=2949092 RepID=A0A9X2KR15_9SPHN|nr:SDR family oxidoreductase [Sphingomonas tagetis]MCP3732328.1 SDR family oxidoreductase [Sphingomonas tagetis]